MIEFRRLTWFEQLSLLIPRNRRAYEKRLRLGIQTLVDDPHAPCVIDGKPVPDGFGNRPYLWDL
jgi:hypothetical protein